MKNKKQRQIVTAMTHAPNDENSYSIQDRSPIIPQRSKLKTNLKIYKRELTEKQHQFLTLAEDKSSKIIFVSGPAGTSKTFLSVLHALSMINEKRVSDLIYIRSAVESSDTKLGFLPGEANDKLAPYIQPLLDKLAEMLPKGDVDTLLKEERVTGIPVGFLRGLNWNAKVIIADEAQNMTFKELFTLITRTGEFSKVFILGDPEQSDINGKSGFIKMIAQFDDEESRQNGIHVFRFTEDDIVRSGLVQFIIKKVKKAL
jgi:phosphate starvation-inducible PhoH-like protein